MGLHTVNNEILLFGKKANKIIIKYIEERAGLQYIDMKINQMTRKKKKSRNKYTIFLLFLVILGFYFLYDQFVGIWLTNQHNETVYPSQVHTTKENKIVNDVKSFQQSSNYEKTQ